MRILTSLVATILLAGCMAQAEVVDGPTEPSAPEATEQVCGGIAGIPCGDGEYCRHAPGTCQIADGQGICKPIKRMCTMDYRPVCGCDGKTYSNACVSGSHGVSVDYDGKCN